MVVCGSAGEVAVDHSLGTQSAYRVDYATALASNKDVNYENHRTSALRGEKHSIWAEAAFRGRDQVRRWNLGMTLFEPRIPHSDLNSNSNAHSI